MMRRFIRRAFLTGRQLGYHQPFLHRLVPVVSQGYGDIYPEVRERAELITGLIQREEERFETTLDAGMSRLEDLLTSLRLKKETQVPGEEVFRLYETFGFPRELTEEIAQESNLSIDEAGYHAAMERHSRISGSAVGEYEQRAFGNLETEFIGYDHLAGDARIMGVRSEGERTQIVLDRTPLYAESGGQIGDSGTLRGDGFHARVLDTQKQGKAYVHTVEIIEGEPREGLGVRAVVDAPRRRAIERAHSATHLLHASLRQHLGKHVEQRGSLVEPDRLHRRHAQRAYFGKRRHRDALHELARCAHAGRDGALRRKVWRYGAHGAHG
jgi:alanyl-tRNA synthetase